MAASLEKTINIVIKATNKAKAALTEPISDLKDFGSKLSALKVPALAVGSAVAGAFAVMAKASIDAADEMSKASQATGVSVESLSTLKWAAEQSGVGFDALKTSLQKFSVGLADTANPVSDTALAFKALGIGVRDAQGNLRPTQELLAQVADRFAGMKDGADKTALATQLFGKAAGPDLLPLLNQGSAGIKALEDEARSLGLEISTGTAQSAELFNDSLNKMKQVATGLVNFSVAEFLPTLANLTSFFSQKGPDGVSKFRGAFEVLGRIVGFIAQVIVSALVIVGHAFEIVGERIGSVAAAMWEFAQGNFKGAWEIMKQSDAEGMETIKASWEDLKAVWSENAAALGPDNPEGVAAKMRGTTAAVNIELEKQKLAKIKADEDEKKRRDKKAKDDATKEKQIQAERHQIIDSALSGLVALSTSKNKALAAVGKAAGIAQATMDTYAGASKALAVIPPPASFAVAAAVVAAGLANVAKIAGVELAEGGVVMPRSGGVRATLAEAGQAEAVIPLDRAEGFGGPTQITVNLDGRSILEWMGRASRDGRLVLDARAVA